MPPDPGSGGIREIRPQSPRFRKEHLQFEDEVEEDQAPPVTLPVIEDVSMQDISDDVTDEEFAATPSEF